MCKTPREVMPGMYVSCGTCLFCRINRARIWQSRILLEEMCWEKSSFCTLTYDDEHLPIDGSVSPRELQLFMKRVRRRCEPIKIRFYGVGEYGDESGRPHYHVALFGVGVESGWCDERKNNVLFSEGRVVESSWSFGHTHVGLIEKASARYITQYVTKFMNFEKSHKLKGRHPEFSRMSNRPGIGAPAMRQIASRLLDCGYSREKVVGDLNYGNGRMPLGKYLKEKLHELRGGDLIAKDIETRVWLDSVGIKYRDDTGLLSLSQINDYASNGVECNGADGSERGSLYSFHLREGKPKRFRVEKNRKQFEKRGRV